MPGTTENLNELVGNTLWLLNGSNTEAKMKHGDLEIKKNLKKLIEKTSWLLYKAQSNI